MKTLDKARLCLPPAILLAAAPVEAYVGPGLGAGALGVILGLLGSILIAVFAFFWYPIKRTFKKWTAPKGESLEEEEQIEVTEEPEK